MSESPGPRIANPQDTDRVIVVDPTGVVYSDADRGAMENRARSSQRAEALRTGLLTAGDIAREADFEQPVAINPVPNSIVPFRFGGDVRPETLNANFAHLGNLVAELQAQHLQTIQALDSLTDRLDRLTLIVEPPIAPSVRHDSKPAAPKTEDAPIAHGKHGRKSHGFAEK